MSSENPFYKLFEAICEIVPLAHHPRVIFVVSIFTAIYLGVKIYFKLSADRRRRAYPADTVILHQFPRCYRVPSNSPFVLKLETWLRMTDIKYQNEHGYTFGPKGKIPWITYNGKDIGDSQLIIEFLGKELGKDLSKGHSAKDLGAARAFFKLAEESIFWVLVLIRFFHEPDPKYVKLPLWLFYLIKLEYKKRGKIQGYGRHTKEECMSIGEQDLKALNDYLQGKKYLAGDKPCNEDASVFGIVAQLVFADRGSMNKFIKEKCPNVQAYIENMKNTYWPDWDQCITMKTDKKDN